MQRLVYFVLFFILIQAAFAAQSSSPKKSTDQIPQAATTEVQKRPFDQRGTENNPITVKIISDPKSREQVDQERSEKEERFANEHSLIFATWFLAFTTGLLFLAAAIQAGLFVWQLRLIRDSAKDAMSAAKAATESAQASKIQAEVAQETLKTMQDTAERQLRAYVLVEARRIKQFDTANPTVVELCIKNVGQTPAYEIQISAGVQVLPVNIPAGTNFNASFQGNISITTVHPNNELFTDARSSTPLSSAEISQIKNGTQNRLYVAGTLKYRDAFKKQRATEFLVSTGGIEFQKAFSLAASLNKPIPEGADVSWQHNRLHNEAD